jgi:hypothetical protein
LTYENKNYTVHDLAGISMFLTKIQSKAEYCQYLINANKNILKVLAMEYRGLEKV